MSRKNNIILLACLFATLLFTGCKSTKNARQEGAWPDVTLAEIEGTQAVQGTLPAYSSKMKLTANVAGNTISSQGTLKMKEGEGVQMSIAPLGLFEVARVEFSPLSVLVINRLKKEYSLMHYGNIALLQQLGLDYALLEAVLQNKIYIPAGATARETLSAMDVALDGDMLLLSTTLRGINYKYYIEKTSGLLVKSVGIHANGTAVTCLYEAFGSVGGKLLPHEITLTLAGTAKGVELFLQLSKLKEEQNYTPATISSSYKKVNISTLVEALGGK